MMYQNSVQIQLARTLYPLQALGPGNRLGIWTYGCKRKCPGCANPELWESDGRSPVDIMVIKEAINTIRKNPKLPQIDGITISGGEPFLQPAALERLLEYLLTVSEDILIFTGYKREELSIYEETIISKLAVLVDGEYIEELNEGHPLKGSGNQNIYYIKKQFKQKYEEYIDRAINLRPMAQIFPTGDGLIIAGIHKNDFLKRYDGSLKGDKRIRKCQK